MIVHQSRPVSDGADQSVQPLLLTVLNCAVLWGTLVLLQLQLFYLTKQHDSTSYIMFNWGLWVNLYRGTVIHIGKLDRSEREIPILTCFFSLKFSSRNRLMVMTCSSVKVWYSILVDCSVCSRFCTSCNFTWSSTQSFSTLSMLQELNQSIWGMIWYQRSSKQDAENL